jgi:uncharacterized protein
MFNETFNLDYVTLNVTNNCNLNCTYCYERDKNHLTMSPEAIIVIIDKIYGNFDYHQKTGKLGIGLFGGEPLLNYPAIVALVNHCKARNYRVSVGLTTNCTLLTDEMISFFAENDIHLLISIDGIKEVHDKNRCNSYDAVAENIKKMVGKGLTYLIEARMTVLPEDVGSMLAGIQNIADLGIDCIIPSIVTDVPWSEEAVVVLEEQVEKVMQYAIDVYNNTDNKRNLAIKMVEDVLEQSLTAQYNYNVPCAYGANNFISIGPAGDIMPCHQRHTMQYKHEELKLGNILKGEINPQKLTGKIFEWYGVDCEQCSASVICRGWCPSENFNMQGDYRAVPTIVCRYNEILYQLIKKYQQKLLDAPNIRSRRLNVLKFNLEMEHRLLNLQKLDFSSSQFLFSLMEFYSMLKGNHTIILPSFRENFFLQFQDLLNLTKEVGNA